MYLPGMWWEHREEEEEGRNNERESAKTDLLVENIKRT